jgi:hypothetical protein
VHILPFPHTAFGLVFQHFPYHSRSEHQHAFRCRRFNSPSPDGTGAASPLSPRPMSNPFPPPWRVVWTVALLPTPAHRPSPLPHHPPYPTIHLTNNLIATLRDRSRAGRLRFAAEEETEEEDLRIGAGESPKRRRAVQAAAHARRRALAAPRRAWPAARVEWR